MVEEWVQRKVVNEVFISAFNQHSIIPTFHHSMRATSIDYHEGTILAVALKTLDVSNSSREDAQCPDGEW
jgi:hypothetical protein